MGAVEVEQYTSGDAETKKKGVFPWSNSHRCDQCGKPLEKGQSLVGLCRRCDGMPVQVARGGMGMGEFLELTNGKP